ncbi:5-oxoprolinase subunit C family protein [Bosea sp. NPDC055594]
MSELLVEACGALTTVQDAGRFGLRRFGVSPAGAMDATALARANALVGNAPDTAAIEFCLMGGRFRLEGGPVLIAFSGKSANATAGGRALDADSSILLESSERLIIGPMREGVYAYLAFAGGIRLAPDMGSLSAHRRSGIGGRPLFQGDRLPLADGSGDARPRRLPPAETLGNAPIRLMLGPQDDLFTERGLKALFREEFAISAQVDRMGCRLEGPKIEHAGGFNIISDGIVPGSIQVPGDGQPIVLLRDGQTTGGYPKIATVISADLDRFAQLPPGSAVRFQLVTREEALAAAKYRKQQLTSFLGSTELLEPGSPANSLFSSNLISGVTNAFDFDYDAGSEAALDPKIFS